MRNNNENLKHIINSLIPVILAFALGAIIILFTGNNPLYAYWILLKKSLFTSKGFLDTLHYASPLILTGLAIAVTFKANVYNMGVEGQMLLGGFFAGLVGSSISVGNPFIEKFICIIVAIICGMAFAMIPAILKVKCNVNEMVVTLMLNYGVVKVLEFLTTGVFKDKSAGYVATPTINDIAMFSRFGKSRITAFFVIVIIVLIVMYFIMKKTKLGYEITAIGKNPEFAEACGMNVGKKIMVIMLLSGALSGMAGAGWMLSDQFKYTLSFSGNPGLGWDGMLVALLGGHTPIGILVASIFYAALKTGSDSINMYTSVPKEIVALIQGIMILFLAVKFIKEKK
nr:ABC transporter permease [uncultured Lachnoanaerobaculum sp.]